MNSENLRTVLPNSLDNLADARKQMKDAVIIAHDYSPPIEDSDLATMVGQGLNERGSHAGVLPRVDHDNGDLADLWIASIAIDPRNADTLALLAIVVDGPADISDVGFAVARGQKVEFGIRKSSTIVVEPLVKRGRAHFA